MLNHLRSNINFNEKSPSNHLTYLALYKSAIRTDFCLLRDYISNAYIVVSYKFKNKFFSTMDIMNVVARLKQLIDITVIDLIGKRFRWIICYQFLSLHYNTRYVRYIPVEEFKNIFSITICFKNAFWIEREVWDMFGIMFLNHFGLRRILTEYGFKGHPLRKDFPLTGFTEVRYSHIEKRVLVEEVSLTQDFRTFNFNNP